MLYYKIRRCMELIDELLLSETMSRDDKRKLIELKEEIFSINEEIVKLKVEVWGIKECLERITDILELDLTKYLRKLRSQTVIVRSQALTTSSFRSRK